MKVRLEAVQGFPYAGRRLSPGDRFDARGERDARLLVAIGKARRVSDVPVASSSPAPAAPRAQVRVQLPPVGHVSTAPAETAAMFPGGDAQQDEAGEAAGQGEAAGDAGTQDQPPADQAPAPRAKRTYRRRDMTAEGGK